ncbi:MAG: hypothetical protein ABIK62_06590 [candidate division WOR-3 bacterium]
MSSPVLDPTPPPQGLNDISGLHSWLKAAFDKWDQAAMKKQGKTLEFGALSAFLIPAAVLFLTVQILFFDHCPQRIIALPLIVIELAILVTAIMILFAELGPRTRGWVHDRVRAEVLRREIFLLGARVGSYLRGPDFPTLLSVVRRRLTEIDKAGSRPVNLIAQAEADSPPWCSELADAAPHWGADPDPAVIAEYYCERLTGQQQWFTRKALQLLSQDRRWRTAARATLITAALIAAAHLTLLAICWTRDSNTLGLLIKTFALVLPPVGAALAAQQVFYPRRHIAFWYQFYAGVLLDVARRWGRALGPAAATMASPLPLEAKRDFKRLVLETEEWLGSELRQWYFLMRPSEPPIH